MKPRSGKAPHQSVITELVEFVEARALHHATSEVPAAEGELGLLRSVLRELGYQDADIDAGGLDWHESSTRTKLRRHLAVERLSVVAGSVFTCLAIGASLAGLKGMLAFAPVAVTLGVLVLGLHLVLRPAA